MVRVSNLLHLYLRLPIVFNLSFLVIRVGVRAVLAVLGGISASTVTKCTVGANAPMVP